MKLRLESLNFRLRSIKWSFSGSRVPFGETPAPIVRRALALRFGSSYSRPMRKRFRNVLVIVLFVSTSWATSKPHVINFGKWITIRWYSGPTEDEPIDAKARPLLVDGKAKEFTLGPPHEITERLFAVRRVLRINDSLSQEAVATRWSWQPAGWLIVDRATGHISPISLPDFDPFSSLASWYRDYIAYCGSTDDHNKLEGIVVQLGRHKPLLRKNVAEMPGDGSTSCAVPEWQRHPTRVTFEPKGASKATFSIRGNFVEMLKEESDEDEEAN